MRHMLAVPLLLAAACAPKLTVTRETVAPGSRITWIGEEAPLHAASGLAVGRPLPETALTNLKMMPETLAAQGRVLLIIAVPSLDTPVCDAQTHLLSETKTLDPRVVRVAVSPDLPYAQRRFSKKARLTNITYLSDYRTGAFGRETGLQIQRNGLLARAVMVVDRGGIVRHLQIVPEITHLPDMEAAFAAANAAARASGS